MRDELRQIDVQILDTLKELKRERETLRGRLARLADAGPQVQDVVLKRVKADYEGRLATIDARAGELKATARAAYRDLAPLREAAEKATEAFRLDEEELGVRQRVGEYSKAEHRRRLDELTANRERHEEEQAELSTLVAQFVDAFDSPEDLESAKPAKRSPAAAPASTGAAEPNIEDELTWAVPPEPPSPPAPPPAPEPPAPPPPAAGTTLPPPAPANAAAAPPPPPAPPQSPPSPGSIPATAPPAPADPGATVMPGALAPPVRAGRLEALDGDIEPVEFVLDALTFVGRTPENQIRIYKPAVSRRHAQIAATDTGWLLRDLSSENGTYVNGQRITERLLADGDRVQFGTSRFVFKSA